MNVRTLCSGLSVALVVMAVAAPLEAATLTLTCGSPVEFTLQVTSGSIEQCVTGNGAQQGLPAPYKDTFSFFDSDNDVLVASPAEGWFTIDTTTKSFSINSSAWIGTSQMALLLQLPTPSPKPDWAVFILSNNVLSGTWAHSDPATVSFAALYRQASTTTTDTSTAPVPEPASLSLLGMGLAGLYARRLRRRSH